MAADPTNATQLAAWLVSAFAVAGGVNQLLKLVDRMRGKPQRPPNEQLEQAQNNLIVRLAAAEKNIELIGTKAEQSIAALSQKGDHNTEILRVEARSRSDKLYAHIDSVRDDLNARMESMPERILTMFRNIRDLGGKG